jgi:hypothetical protein
LEPEARVVTENLENAHAQASESVAESGLEGGPRYTENIRVPRTMGEFMKSQFGWDANFKGIGAVGWI